jgi:hypothetical protein
VRGALGLGIVGEYVGSSVEGGPEAIGMSRMMGRNAVGDALGLH